MPLLFSKCLRQVFSHSGPFFVFSWIIKEENSCVLTADKHFFFRKQNATLAYELGVMR